MFSMATDLLKLLEARPRVCVGLRLRGLSHVGASKIRGNACEVLAKGSLR